MCFYFYEYLELLNCKYFLDILEREARFLDALLRNSIDALVAGLTY